MRTDPQPPTYEGPSRRLVVAFDVGTTFSGVSYCFLDPGVVPKICSLTKYPGQASGGSSKIPTVMYYDKEGNMKCAGAETQLPENEMNADDEEWIKVDWFKLRLRPKSMPSKLENAKLPPLPKGKNIVQVFADFLGYLILCTETFIKETYSMITDDVWKKLQTDMVIVLAHPNGWEGAQQNQMRDAAILAKIIPNKPSARERVVFVSEGEASLHFCVKGEFIDDAERGFIIADLGGGTLDFSAYKVCGQKPLKVEEMDASKCLLEGSVLVTQRAHVSFRKKLEGSTYGDEKTIAQISDKFDETTKKVFRTKNDTCLVVFGSPRDDDKAYGIRGGRLKLGGDEVAAYFEPSISATVKAVEEHIRASPIKVSAVYMVGGFSASPYLKSEVESRLKSHNIKVATPDGQAVKAVADGAVSFYIDHYVMARVAKASYGVICSKFLEEDRPDHMKRKATAFVTASGYEYLPGGFATILKKGTVVSEETEFRDHFHREYEMDIAPPAIRSVISVYSGAGDPPNWVDEMAEIPRQLCTVVADMTKIKATEVEETTKEGGRYKSYNYDVLLFFGGPELKAQTAWMENGVEKCGPATIVYENAPSLSALDTIASWKSDKPIKDSGAPPPTTSNAQNAPHERPFKSTGFFGLESRYKSSSSSSSKDSSGSRKPIEALKSQSHGYSDHRVAPGWKISKLPSSSETYETNWGLASDSEPPRIKHPPFESYKFASELEPPRIKHPPFDSYKLTRAPEAANDSSLSSFFKSPSMSRRESDRGDHSYGQLPPLVPDRTTSSRSRERASDRGDQSYGQLPIFVPDRTGSYRSREREGNNNPFLSSDADNYFPSTGNSPRLQYGYGQLPPFDDTRHKTRDRRS